MRIILETIIINSYNENISTYLSVFCRIWPQYEKNRVQMKIFLTIDNKICCQLLTCPTVCAIIYLWCLYLQPRAKEAFQNEKTQSKNPGHYLHYNRRFRLFAHVSVCKACRWASSLSESFFPQLYSAYIYQRHDAARRYNLKRKEK